MATIQADSPLAAELTRIVQPKLVDLGWETGGGDDNTLTEYILLMLVNGKTEEQIASELSNDLLSLGPDDPVATDFARWLFEQVAVLTNQKPATDQAGGQAIPSFTGDASATSGQHAQHDGNDADMGDAMDGLNQDGAIPTGPKSMRNNPRGGNNGRRIMGHLNRAMDRSNDAGLHRIKGQAGRINVHERGPPRGPRAHSGPGRGGMQSGGRGGGGRGRGGFNGPDMGISPQQQMQLLEMMTTIFNPAQGMMGGMGGEAAINPAFQNNQGRSLFDRVDKRGGHRGHKGRQQGEQGDDTSMDLGEGKSELGPDTICRFNLKCTKADCIFAHQSPVAPPGTHVDVSDVCAYGAACQNRKCTGRHPSPAQRKQHAAETECKFFPNCTNRNCPFQHPTMPLCKNGADCTTEGCAFTHLKTVCKFNPCMNPKCPYKHEEGQRKRTFQDMQWRAERKFVTEDGAEVLIKPETEEHEDAAGTVTGQEDVEIAT